MDRPDQWPGLNRDIASEQASGVYQRQPYGKCDCDVVIQCGPLIEHANLRLRLHYRIADSNGERPKPQARRPCDMRSATYRIATQQREMTRRLRDMNGPKRFINMALYNLSSMVNGISGILQAVSGIGEAPPNSIHRLTHSTLQERENNFLGG